VADVKFRGRRLNKQFANRRDAVAWVAQVQVDIKAGKYAPPDKDATVAKAAELWIAACENPVGRKPKERATIAEYQRVVKHVLGGFGPKEPSLGAVRRGGCLRPTGRAPARLARMYGGARRRLRRCDGGGPGGRGGTMRRIAGRRGLDQWVAV